MARRAADWPWSSVHAHLGKDDDLTQRAPVLERFPDFEALIDAGEDEALSQSLRPAETIGRPLGSNAFLARFERKAGRLLKRAKRGRKPKPAAEDGGG